MTIHAEQIAAARGVDILATARRFVSLKLEGSNEHVGRCPRCGGRDRFGVNTRKRVFNCRGCGAGGDVILFPQPFRSHSLLKKLRRSSTHPP